MRLALQIRIHTADLHIMFLKLSIYRFVLNMGVLVVPRAATSCGLLLYLFLHIRASASRVSTIIHTVVKLPGAHLLIIVVVLVVSFEVVVVNVLVEVGHDGEDAHVDEHEDSKHEELGSLADNL